MGVGLDNRQNEGVGLQPRHSSAGNISLFREKTFWIILIAALGLRLWLSLTTAFIYDEHRDWVLAARSISFSPDQLNLPLRTGKHGAFAAYFMKLGALIFGDSVFGFRLGSIVFGMATIPVMAAIADEWKGRGAAIWVAVLLAFNEFHVFLSFIAIQSGYTIFLLAVTTYAFMRAFKTGKARWLYATAVAAGVGFMSYEVFALAAPAFAVSIVFSPRRIWFKSIHLYGAAALGLAIVAVDLAATFATSQGRGYGQHLEHFGGIGFSRFYLQFFFRDFAGFIYQSLGRDIYDTAPEYISMNAVVGLIICVSFVFYGVLFLLKNQYRTDPFLLFLISSFAMLFGFFLFVKTGFSDGETVSKAWYWACLSLVPGSILAGAAMARLGDWNKPVAFTIGLVAVAVSIFMLSQVDKRIARYTVAFLAEENVDGTAAWSKTRFYFGGCQLCDPHPRLKLVDIQTFRNRQLKSAIDNGEVRGARKGEADASLFLNTRDHKSDQYFATYRLTERSGRETILKERFGWDAVARESIYRTGPQPLTSE